MKVLIPGGSGQLGTALARAFSRDGHHVTVFSRNGPVDQWTHGPMPKWTSEPMNRWRLVRWDGVKLSPWRPASSRPAARGNVRSTRSWRRTHERSGDGRQFVSWIHYRDFIAAVRWLIEHEDVSGIVNVAAPTPIPQAAFLRALREAAGVPFGLPATKWMLELGAFFMRTETELILKSRRVVPARLLEGGFQFEFTEWADAARDLCQDLNEAAPGATVDS